MNKKFIDQIPSYLKEFDISNEEIKKQQKWIEQKIMLTFQDSLNQMMQEKIEQEFILQNSNGESQTSSQSSSQQRRKGNKDFRVPNYQQSFSQNLIDIHLIKSQMKINQKEYPKLFPAQQLQNEKAKGDQALKTISQSSYIRHNISTQSTNIPPTSINNRHSKNDESLTTHANDDEAGGVSAFSVNPSSMNYINNCQFNQNKNKRNVQHKKSLSNASRELSYAEQQKKKKLFHMNNNSFNGQNNNSFNGQNNQSYNINNSFSYQNSGNQSFSYTNNSNNVISNNSSNLNYNMNKKNIYDINLTLPLN